MTTFINHYAFDVLVVVAYYELYVIFIAADLTKPSLLIFKVNNAVELHCVGTVLVNREGGYIDPIKNIILYKCIMDFAV